MHLNVRSIRSKLNELKSVVKQHSPHIFGISEAELFKDRISEDSLKIPGYRILFPKSWFAHGYARVVVYVNKTFKCEQVSTIEDDKIQSIWLKGGYQNSKDILFCHMYREHLSKEGIREQQNYLDGFLKQCEEATMVGSTAESNEVHICGDVNIDVYEGRWLRPDYHLITLSRMIKNFCHLHNFYQLVCGITRSQYNSVSNTTEVSCIDHIYTNAKFRCSEPSVISFGDSDHDLLKYVRFSKLPPVPTRVICKRSYKKFDKSAFLHDVSLIDWSDVFSCSDVDKATVLFTQKFRYVLNIHAPWVRIQQRKSFTPWLTETTKNMIKLRDYWKKTAKYLSLHSSTTNDEQAFAWEQFKRFRNCINNRKKFEESMYKTEKMEEVAGQADLVWKNAKSFMGWKCKGTPNQIKIGNELITSARKIANLMNDYFVEKISTIRASMGSASFPISKLKNMMRGKNCRMQLNHISIEKVRRILKNLSNSKSTGIDELDNFSVKLAADFIAWPLHHIICLSIIHSKFPQSWKYSKVLPLYKKGDKLERKNYRPVSILSPLSKVLEKVVYEQIYSYFTRNHLFHQNLHGYRCNRSTQTALIQMYDRWIRAAHNGKLSGVVLLDLSAAFDLVDPQLLMKKLEVYGFDKDCLV